jgi:hypothetical protein
VTCSFSPARVIPGSSAAQATLTMSTVKSSSTTTHPALALWLVFPGMVLILPLRRRRVRTCAALLLLMVGMISCGGGGSSNSPTAAASVSGTQPGTYQITVVGDAGGLTHTSQISLTVQ